MSYTDFFNHIKKSYPNVHVEGGYEGWTMFFSNDKMVALYNDYTGEMDELYEAKEEVA